MGLLERMFGKKPTFAERVWLTEERKLEDFEKQLETDSREGAVTSLAIYHFPITGERVRQRLDRRGLEYRELRRPGTDQLEQLPTWRGAGTIAVLASDEIPEEIKRGIHHRRRVDDQTPVRVQLVEHFPMPQRDDHVLNLAMYLPRGTTFSCYTGLDEPWVTKFLGSSTRELLERLGASDDEPLSHSMISAALRRAQEQLAKKRRSLEQPARSCEEWMERNVS
ncbi:MAG TPA: hypothetical protein VEK15_11120 [Vicinamibacteria bacterium]|nr:hypothetical protein [Vicinamibacteria bacterium]